jgi:endonuclease YncB( thermonuclease family)
MRPMRSFVIAAVLLAVVPQLHAADAVEWRVVNVADGDTITCLDEGKRQLKARLHGIDAVVRAPKDAGPGTLRCPSRF